jgi:hypothetical protein
MTPKEKAEELVDKMYNTEHCGITHFPSKKYCDCSEINIYQAKQCALITVDEISKHCYEVMKPFWQQVKQEIEKL